MIYKAEKNGFSIEGRREIPYFVICYLLFNQLEWHPKKPHGRDFLRGPVVKTLPSNAGEEGLIPSWELRPYMSQGQRIKKSKYQSRSYTVTNSIQILKMIHIKRS